MCVLMSRNFKGAIIVGILFTTIIAWIPGHGGSYLGKTSNLPGGIGGTGPARWDYFKKVVAAPTLSKTGAALNFSGMGSGDVWVALITFLYVDFFDTTGTLFSMARFIDGYIPGFIDENKNFPRSIFAYCADGISIVVGSLMGTSPLTVFIESATGIREGGRTGITALTTGFCFFISMFFAPLLASIPVFATGPALILVGALMLANAAKIDWQDINKAVPAFLTIVVMPLSYSIAYGVIAGIVSYTLLQCTAKALDFLSDHTNGAFGRAQRHVEVGDDKLADVIDHPKMDALAFKEQGEDTAHNGVKQPKEEV
jgi:AGZA family xanthine/uracil permease-like MFS transporter